VLLNIYGRDLKLPEYPKWNTLWWWWLSSRYWWRWRNRNLKRNFILGKEEVAPSDITSVDTSSQMS